jgi:hypothetical protein
MEYPVDTSCLKTQNAYDEIEDTLGKSDDILCNNMRYYNFYAKLKDDRAFCHQMQNCYLPSQKEIDAETKLWRGKKGMDCSIGYHLTRAGNSKTPSCKPPYKSYAGYDNYNNESLEEYLMIPCKQNTFRNYVACDNNKCCSIRHQLFMNNTKRI